MGSEKTLRSDLIGLLFMTACRAATLTFGVMMLWGVANGEVRYWWYAVPFAVAMIVVALANVRVGFLNHDPEAPNGNA